MTQQQEVLDYIAANRFDADEFDALSDTKKAKLINQSAQTLKTFLNYKTLELVPIEEIAEQCLWTLRINEYVKRAEVGITAIAVDGISVAVSEKDTTIAKAIMLKHGKTTVRKIKTGQYASTRWDSNRIFVDESYFWRW